MQKDRTMWVILVVIVALVGLGFWYVAEEPSNTNGDTTAVTPTTGTTPAVTHTTGTKTTVPSTAGRAISVGIDTISHLLTLSLNYKCTVVETTPSRSGVMYVSGTKMRADLTSLVNGSTTLVSMVDDGQYLYTWNAGNTTVLKLNAATSGSGTVAASHGGINPNIAVNYECNPWVADAGIFSPPASATFVDSTGARIL